CHIDLTWHRDRQSIICHYCGFQADSPTKCPTCQGTNLKDVGLGIEKVAEEAKRLFPHARITTVSSDTLTTSKASNDLFNSIESGEVD
ncbi:MAG: primosomal protein N', partial [Alphaproteobacteria bacterium]|nr:primosomal protein N' [Alphaproteobacteria bacterium]